MNRQKQVEHIRILHIQDIFRASQKNKEKEEMIEYIIHY
jgi:hypothetical protein